jgi:hypothetical protein
MNLSTENRASWFVRRGVWTAVALGMDAWGRGMIDGFASREMDTRDGSLAGRIRRRRQQYRMASFGPGRSWFSA